MCLQDVRFIVGSLYLVFVLNHVFTFPGCLLFCNICITMFMSYFLCGFEGKRCILLMKNLYAYTFCPIEWFKLKWMAISLHVYNPCMWICNVFFVWWLVENNHKTIYASKFFTKCWKNIELHLQRHRVTSHKICIFNNTVARNQNLATYELLICSLTQSLCLGWLIKLSHFKIWFKSVPLRIEVCAKISKGGVMWNPPSDISRQACEVEQSCIWKRLYVDGGHAHIFFSVDKPVFLTYWLFWGINLDHLSGN